MDQSQIRWHRGRFRRNRSFYLVLDGCTKGDVWRDLPRAVLQRCLPRMMELFDVGRAGLAHFMIGIAGAPPPWAGLCDSYIVAIPAAHRCDSKRLVLSVLRP